MIETRAYDMEAFMELHGSNDAWEAEPSQYATLDPHGALNPDVPLGRAKLAKQPPALLETSHGTGYHIGLEPLLHFAQLRRRHPPVFGIYSETDGVGEPQRLGSVLAEMSGKSQQEIDNSRAWTKCLSYQRPAGHSRWLADGHPFVGVQAIDTKRYRVPHGREGGSLGSMPARLLYTEVPPSMEQVFVSMQRAYDRRDVMRFLDEFGRLDDMERELPVKEREKMIEAGLYKFLMPLIAEDPESCYKFFLEEMPPPLQELAFKLKRSDIVYSAIDFPAERETWERHLHSHPGIFFGAMMTTEQLREDPGSAWPALATPMEDLKKYNWL